MEVDRYEGASAVRSFWIPTTSVPQRYTYLPCLSTCSPANYTTATYGPANEFTKKTRGKRHVVVPPTINRTDAAVSFLVSGMKRFSVLCVAAVQSRKRYLRKLVRKYGLPRYSLYRAATSFQYHAPLPVPETLSLA